MNTVKSIIAREILDSRGNPALEVKCILESGYYGIASVPSGASTGTKEAYELRDGGGRYSGKGVLTAVNNVNEKISSAIIGKDFDQKTLDETLISLDGSENKSVLGANAILGVSLAFARAVASSESIPLYEYIRKISGTPKIKMPKLMLNVINGGLHADSGLEVQEFMLIPSEINSVKESVRAGAEIIQVLKKKLKSAGYSTSVGDEGGFAPKLKSNEEALDFLVSAIDEAGYNEQVKIGLDAAASSFGTVDEYKMGGTTLSTLQMVEWYKTISSKYPIISIEDGLEENDWEGFKALKSALPNLNVIGDDLTVTNTKYIQEAKDKDAINAVLIKLNQIGTLTETINSIDLTHKYGYASCISHRSGETTDAFIADLCVGTASEYLKAGSLTRGERVAKYNRLMEIEDEN